MLKLVKRGATYYARGTIAGQRVYESTGCRRRTDAELYAQRRAREILDRHALGPGATLTFAEAALEYMNTGGERRFLGPILDHFGPDFLLADLDNAALSDAAATLYPDAAPATINRQLVTPCRAIVNQAAEDGLTPPRRLRARKGDRARTRWLRPAEADRLLLEAGPHLAPIVAALLGTGLRVGELLGAQVAHFHPDTGELWIEDTKNDHPRMAKMPARARDALLARGVTSGRLVRRPDGEAYALGPGQTPIKTAFHRARAAAGLGPDVTPHVLRHTWATWYYAQTRDFGGLLDLGGWRVPDMAMRYRKMAPEGLADELQAAGWDFTRLGAAIPRPAQAAPALRVVK